MRRHVWEITITSGLLLAAGGLALVSVPLALLFAGGCVVAAGVLGSLHEALTAERARKAKNPEGN